MSSLQSDLTEQIAELKARNAQLQAELQKHRALSERLANHHDTDLKQHQESLRQSEEWFRRVFEDSPIGMGMTTPSGQFLMANHRLCQITGYSHAELLTLTFWDLTHPEDCYKEFEILQSILQGEEERMSIEKRYIRKDKTVIWIQVTVALMKSEMGELQYQIGMVEDVSDRKAAEAELKASLHAKEILLKEIHHRVKNNMQTVSSLLSLQASYIENPEILAPFTESQNRIRVMALLHERLYRSENLAKVSFPEYVHKLVTELVNSYQFRDFSVAMELAIANVELEIDVAMPCGLIINELVSNSLKHGFPQGRSGKICVRLAQLDSQAYSLTVIDDGIGIPEGITPNNSDSLGLQLISAFTKKLHGELSIDRTAGTAITVTFTLPASNLFAS
jgi:PAS domain S-box-containing protein